MDNSFFLRSENSSIEIEKFQICTWEFNNDNSLIEFGIEIKANGLTGYKELVLDLYIPWLEKGVKVKDFYNKLKHSDNSRFIFNDSIASTSPLDDGQNTQGVIHQFNGKDKLCILPVNLDNIYTNKKIQIKVDLEDYNNKAKEVNAYVRIAIEPIAGSIATSKKGIGKSTIIYDIKLNESRNIPTSLIQEFKNNSTCKIDSCFCFHIIPNRYSITFLESEHLKTVRTLEFEPFKNYLDDSRLKKDELMVVFSKKKDGDSYSFFSIYTEERIGASQFALAVLINIICGFLFALPTIREGMLENTSKKEIFQKIPIEFIIALFLALAMLFYFFTPSIIQLFKKVKTFIFSLFKGKKQ
ncbi:hypothetical protein [Leeuwenhoekiella marinoflava]|uniref:Uncharacterized protein n=2 Tax=Leeuwenhoekiella marinoflava TaxID=988 RepID=A0A4Q0PFZ5_9FLAO|nr:hypothetical protein [Leeuwenhoekiella marinoflava]RXG25446.1 hypothetical protein DSL99_3479 [Leeuwenhoekiella marinoflava]SHF86804.1 hypothetical protein SAMN02745246_03607 [Leeuwenhoekiella marinoflava DSM 3653]